MVRAFLSIVGMLLLVTFTGTASPADRVRPFLATTFRLTNADLEHLDAGQVVSRTIAARDPREVATLGVVRMRVTPEFYVERLNDIVHFKRDEAVLQIGAFGNPPALGDVASLSLDEGDIAKLRACRVNDCGLQLSAGAIDRFRTKVDWRREDAEQRANRLMQEILVEYVARYRELGSAASMEYADRDPLVHLGREFSSLLDADEATWQRFAGLRRHLLQYPAVRSSSATDILYWSKERVGRRNVIGITHLAIDRAPDAPAAFAIASKHVYGTHYFDASLGLTVLLRDSSAPSPAMYVVYLNRSRVDIFTGMFGGIARKIVSTRARSTVTEQLARLQQSLERQFADGPG